jgi:hypothetical protein
MQGKLRWVARTTGAAVNVAPANNLRMANSKLARARQEIALVKDEMRAVIHYYKRCVGVLSDTFTTLTQQATQEGGPG